MAIPNITTPAPSDPEQRKLAIENSGADELEKISQHVQGMISFASKHTPQHPDYHIWCAFLSEIKAEQRKRSERSN
jgi:hypothetical protein